MKISKTNEFCKWEPIPQELVTSSALFGISEDIVVGFHSYDQWSKSFSTLFICETDWDFEDYEDGCTDDQWGILFYAGNFEQPKIIKKEILKDFLKKEEIKFSEKNDWIETICIFIGEL